MKRFLVSCVLVLAGSSLRGQNPPLVLEKTIYLPAVQGKFDHFAVDEAGNRIFAAATGNKSVEVIDLGSGKILQSLTGLGKPHGLAWMASTGQLFVADGASGVLDLYGGAPLGLVKSIPLSEDADDMVYDASSGLLYVGHGGSDAAHPGRIAVIDTKNLTQKASISATSHPEELEVDKSTDRVFANIADAAEISVIDGRTAMQSTIWKLTGAKNNVPLAYDEEQHILFVACRTPARLLVLDGDTGKQLANLPSDPGADDLFYDAETHQVYLIAGSGAIDVYRTDEKNVKAAGVIHTAAGAKTGLFVRSRKTLYVGVPGSGESAASILVYSTR